MSSTATPVQEQERIIILDSLRGFAILDMTQHDLKEATTSSEITCFTAILMTMQIKN